MSLWKGMSFMERNSLRIINWRKWGGRGEGAELKNFIIFQTWKTCHQINKQCSLGEICLISDQGCGSAVRVVLREFLAQSEMREDHNYYGSLFFWECQPSFADPRGLNNLKSGLAVQLFLSPLSVPSETWGCSLLFSKPALCLTSETLLSSKWRSLFVRATCSNPPCKQSLTPERCLGLLDWVSHGAGLRGLGALCAERTRCCLGHDLADYRCAKCTSGRCV